LEQPERRVRLALQGIKEKPVPLERPDLKEQQDSRVLRVPLAYWVSRGLSARLDYQELLGMMV
jgi:predicted chitinase